MYQPPSNKKPVMKCKHLHAIPEKKKVWPSSGSIKKDGVYAFQIISKGDYRIFSRTGMPYTSLRHINNAGCDCRNHPANQGMDDVVLLMEIHHATKPVNVISGWCRDQKAQHEELFAVVHDMIPLTDFIAGRCEIPFSERNKRVRKYVEPLSEYHTEHPFIIYNEEHANELFELFTDDGEEGIIGRNPDGIWIGGHRKNADYWKMKIELSYDLRVTGVESGRPGTKYEHTLGKLRCHFRAFGKPDGEEVVVKASGMTDKQRDLWWTNRNGPATMELLDGDPIDIIDCIVKIDGMSFTKNGLIREPRFKEVRLDKTVADI